VLGVIAVSACAGAAARGQSKPQVVAVRVAPQTNSATLTLEQRAEFARAQDAARRILAGAEFQRAAPTWWDRLKQRIRDAIVRLFMGVDRVTSRSPWMGRALEWLLFVAAAVGLLVWLLRTVQRQRLRVGVGGEPAKASGWARDTQDWRRSAEDAAAKGAWREAVHALYWAAIVHLEQRRAWRHNPARTPREYVRLLKAGSAEQRELRGLTAALERSWYGQREVSAEEFGAARESFERIASDAGGANEAARSGA
jgi:hypothetical protein